MDLRYLPTFPEFPEQSLKVTSCPAVLKANKFVPEIIHQAHVFTTYKADKLEWVPVPVDQNSQSRQNWQKVKQVAAGLETL